MKKDYPKFKEEVVDKFYKLFPLYLLPKEIFDHAKMAGFDLSNKKEQAITALNNLFFKRRNKGEK